jgi:tRNA 5-methylaminomethyl-2-thiouridine biosynthesis bifunctional protein
MTPAWHLPVQAVRGQASWAREAEDSAVAAALPTFPVNGHGSVIAHVPDPAGSFWILGSTFERDEQSTQASEAEVRQRHQSNLDKLQTLLPSAAALLSPAIQDPSCHAFIGIRCASADRLPLVGHWGNAGHSSQRSAGDDPLQGLCISTAMGSRGLTFALLCAELLAAQLHGEPWPLERRLAQALDIHRGT